MDDVAAGERTRGRRFLHPWRVAGLVLFVAAALAASFIVGRLVPSSDREAIAASVERIAVDAEVQYRTVDSRTSIAGRIVAGRAVDVLVRMRPEVPVVTRQLLARGDPFRSGDLVGVVAGTPYFAFAGPLPLYRDLMPGDEGDDVKALQRSLIAAGAEIDQTGWVDWATLTAVRDLYASHGLTLPRTIDDEGTKREYIPFANFIDARTGAGTVTAVADVGAWLEGETPLITVEVSPSHAVFRADAVTAASLKVGDPVTVRAGTVQYEAKIDSISEFRDAGDAATPGRDVALASDDMALQALAVGSTVTVLVGGEATGSLAVPLIAVRQDNVGDYVLRKAVPGSKAAGSRPAYERVAIEVTATGNGWAAIDDGTLEAGDLVRVS